MRTNIRQGLGIDQGSSSSYWTPQSLVIEDAAPTHVVMTGPVANPNAVASDFVIQGNTISSLSKDATNKILTLTLSTAVYSGDSFLVLYNGNYYSVTNNVAMCAEYLAVYNAMTSKPDAFDAAVQNRFVIDRKASGVWAKLDRFFFFGQSVNSASEALIEWVNPSVGVGRNAILSATPPTFVARKGFQGVPASSTYINTKFNPDGSGNYKLNSAGVGTYILNDKTAENGTLVGSVNGSGGTQIDTKVTDGGNVLYTVINAAWAGYWGVIKDLSYGFYHINRSSSTVVDTYKELIDSNATKSSSALVNKEFYALARNYNDVADRFSSDLIGALWFSGSLTTADVTDLRIGVMTMNLGNWIPQGTVLSYGQIQDDHTVMEPIIAYEGSPKILTTATGNVFKMLYTAGWTTPSINYAESLDGKAWKKYSLNPLIPNHCRASSAIKVNGVWYLYTLNVLTGAIDLYTSTDFFNFALDTASVLTKGTGSEWDSNDIANTSILYDAGTWYLYYDASKVGTVYFTGLATTADGRAFTKYGSGPVIPSTPLEWAGPDVHKIGSDFYMWGLGGRAYTTPTDISYRYKSTDKLTWVKDTYNFSLIRLLADEGFGTAHGQLGDPGLYEINGKVYFFYDSTSDGTLDSGDLHIKLSIANCTLAELITTQEGNSTAKP